MRDSITLSNDNLLKAFSDAPKLLRFYPEVARVIRGVLEFGVLDSVVVYANSRGENTCLVSFEFNSGGRYSKKNIEAKGILKIEYRCEILY